MKEDSFRFWGQKVKVIMIVALKIIFCNAIIVKVLNEESYTSYTDGGIFEEWKTSIDVGSKRQGKSRINAQ